MVSRIFQKTFKFLTKYKYGPVFLFVFDRLNIDLYLTSSSSVDSKFHALHHYIVEIGKKLSINHILGF